MGFDKKENAKTYVPQDGDTLESIAKRETTEGNPLTWEEIARYNWGTADRDEVEALLRDELGCHKRNEDNQFVISTDDQPHSSLLIPRPFKNSGLSLDKLHTLHVRRKTCPKQFMGCCSLPGITFGYNSSFIRPTVVEHLKPLEALANQYPDAKVMIFGHTDAVGSELYNKELSERRAWSVFAFITNDPDVWETLYQDPDEDWGVRVVQEILADLGHDPGNIDGQMGPKTRTAMRSFLGLPDQAPVSNDPPFRKKLFAAYMSSKHDIDLPRDRFMDPEYMGCGEFNLLEERPDAHEANRRVTFYMFHKDRLPRLPCALADIEPCKKQMDPSEPRYEKTFHCNFYDSIARKCTAESPIAEYMVHISLLLRSNSGCIPISNQPYKLYLDSGVVEGMTDEEGLLEQNNIPPGDYDLEVNGISTIVPTIPLNSKPKIHRVPSWYLFNVGDE